MFPAPVCESSLRQRLNVLAALDAISHELITVTNLSYINAESVYELLRLLAAGQLSMPITVVLDNARYQRCKLVQELAQSLGIELLFLLPYSPNLNLIERFWKFVKKQCLYWKYYPNSAAFQAAILSFIAEQAQKGVGKFAYLEVSDFQGPTDSG